MKKSKPPPASTAKVRERPDPAPDPPPQQLRIPPILLEGDEPPPELPLPPKPAPPASAAALGPASAPAAELPKTYGAARLLLLARDPHSLYASWDLTEAQQKDLKGRQLTLRLHRGDLTGPVAVEVNLKPELRHEFVQVPSAGCKYMAQLGYYNSSHHWIPVNVSAPVNTPVEAVSEDKSARFVTLPTEPAKPLPAPAQPPSSIPSMLSPLIPPQVGWIPPLGIVPKTAPGPSTVTPQLEAGFEKTFPVGAELMAPPAPDWSAEQERAFALLSDVPLHRVLSSLELAEAPSLSSPAGAVTAAVPDFWLNLNADLVLYGSTHPQAQITLGGQPIQVGSDGSFTCRLALPDGHYELTMTAVSLEGETRRALLKFERCTQWPD